MIPLWRIVPDGAEGKMNGSFLAGVLEIEGVFVKMPPEWDYSGGMGEANRIRGG
jgi:hypothetical protein